MAKLEVLSLLEDLEARGLREPLFREQLHHLGGTIKQFRAFVASVGFFRKVDAISCSRIDWNTSGRNVIAAHLRKRPWQTSLKKPSVLSPCKAYLTCKKHVSDTNCSIPKP